MKLQEVSSSYRSPLLTPWSLWRSSGAATKTSAWTSSMPRPPPQVNPSRPSMSSCLNEMHERLQENEVCLTCFKPRAQISQTCSPLQGWCATGPLICMPAGLMDSQEPLSMSPAHGSCHGTIKVCVWVCMHSICGVCGYRCALARQNIRKTAREICTGHLDFIITQLLQKFKAD